MNDNDFLQPEGPIKISGKQLMESPEMQEIAEQVIEQEDMKFGPAEIG